MTTTAAPIQFRRYEGKHRHDGETFSYVIGKADGQWKLSIYRQSTIAGMTVLAERYEFDYAPTLGLAKAIAAHYEADTDADTKPSQNRLTRATLRAYDEEN